MDKQTDRRTEVRT